MLFEYFLCQFLAAWLLWEVQENILWYCLVFTHQRKFFWNSQILILHHTNSVAGCMNEFLLVKASLKSNDLIVTRRRKKQVFSKFDTFLMGQNSTRLLFFIYLKIGLKELIYTFDILSAAIIKYNDSSVMSFSWLIFEKNCFFDCNLDFFFIFSTKCIISVLPHNLLL